MAMKIAAIVLSTLLLPVGSYVVFYANAMSEAGSKQCDAAQSFLVCDPLHYALPLALSSLLFIAIAAGVVWLFMRHRSAKNRNAQSSL